MAKVKMDSADGTTIPRLLLVVSDDLIRDIFRKLFERSGYQTVAVEKAKDGLELLEMSALMSSYVTSIYMTARELSFSSRPRKFASTESTF